MSFPHEPVTPPLPERRPPRRRHALSAPRGAFHLDGEAEAAARLRAALDVPPLPEVILDEDRPLLESSLHTHLFHSFAARTHPLLVRSLLADLQPGQTVFDP